MINYLIRLYHQESLTPVSMIERLVCRRLESSGQLLAAKYDVFQRKLSNS